MTTGKIGAMAACGLASEGGLGENGGMAEVTLLVLAAGMGSRYGGLKQLDPMGPGGELLLDYSVFDAVRAGFGRVVFLIRREMEEDFRSLIGERYTGRLDVGYAFQDLDALPGGRCVPEGRTKPWGTGQAVLCAGGEITGPFVAINADDFYGREAYAAMGDFLRSVDDVARFAMAGYRLDRTLSEHGTVSRGVCELDGGGRLRAVSEFTALARTPEGIQQVDGRSFSGAEIVSMNFWGFTPAVFPLLEEGFASFLDRHGDDVKAEFYIPSAVAAMIQGGRASVDVLPTDAGWFGVTYREDKPVVQGALSRLVGEGAYPSPLWS